MAGTQWFRGILAVAAVAAVLAVVLPPLFFRAPTDVEVAVLFPSTNTSAWPDFARAVRLAAEEKSLTVTETPDRRGIIVDRPGRPIRFQWYPVIGSFELRQQVRTLCQRQPPPIAIVGANNTSLTQAIGEEIRSSSQEGGGPALLMTSATADCLIDVHPGRTYRFGFNNSYQARAVVEQIGVEVRSRSESAPVKAVVVQALDNPFSTDLAVQFEKALREDLRAELVPAASPFVAETEGEPLIWSIRTSTSARGAATQEEKTLAAHIAQLLKDDADATFVLVLPFGDESFTNVNNALARALNSNGLTTPLDRLIVATGDSMDYFDFAEGTRERLHPKETPGNFVFFSHVNPVDPSVNPVPDEHTPSVGLNRTLARTLIDRITSLEGSPTADDLVSALDQMPAGGDVEFEGHERVTGGGAVVVIPKPGQNRYDIKLPSAWRTDAPSSSADRQAPPTTVAAPETGPGAPGR